MKYNSDFRHDLEVGQVGEKALASILLNKTIEVKTDFGTQKTGNLFVEYHSRGKPSGIATSEADYWCFIISNHQLVIIETERLKEICREHWDRRVKGGDSNTSLGVLVPVISIVK